MAVSGRSVLLVEETTDPWLVTDNYPTCTIYILLGSILEPRQMHMWKAMVWDHSAIKTPKSWSTWLGLVKCAKPEKGLTGRQDFSVSEN